MSPFRPDAAKTRSISVSSSSQRVAVTFDPGSDCVRVRNAGTAEAFIEVGDDSVTAAVATAMPIAAGAIEVFSVPSGTTHIAAIAVGSTGTIYFTPGSGV
jgi:hypothetical protein